MDIELRPLLSKLNNESKSSLEAAIHFCLTKKKSTVDLENWVIQLLSKDDLAISYMLNHYKVKVQDILKLLHYSQVTSDVESTEVPSLSREVVDVMHNAWMIASVEFNESYIHSGYILLAILNDLESLGFDNKVINILKLIDLPELKVNFTKIVKGCAEAHKTSLAKTPSYNKDTDALKSFTKDLIEEARSKKIDRAVGRKEEVNQVIDILCRRKQNNPILVGEAGVGKTAIVEELAYRIAEGSVNDELKDVSLLVLDLTALQAGASIKGEFEQRLKNIINEIKSSSKKVLLFIDEIHNLIGVGSGTAGQNDAANLLKPELARGDIFVIGATTWGEYKKYFEKDTALTRRFQLIKVKEPNQEDSVYIVRNVANLLEKHHGIKILDEAIGESVKLTSRYLINQQLPDKAISLLDTACTKVKLEQTIPPVELQKMQEDIDLIKQHIDRLKKEKGENKEAKLLEEKKKSLEKQYNEKQGIWELKTNFIKELKKINNEENKDLYSKKQKELHNLYKKLPIVYENVNAEVIADILSNWTGIPIANTGSIASDVQSLLNLDKIMQERVVGQDDAVQKIIQTIKISKGYIADPSKPIGVFLLAGGSGVGKTETALSIAEAIYGNENRVITINMSEFKEPHKVASLIGSPPGYVGYGEGGKLTEKVRRNPYSIVLLDEIEKAHSDVQELFLQVFDKGILTDSEGIDVNFKNTIIIMTSNLGAARIREYSEQKKSYDIEELSSYINEDLLKVFKPEFLGRVSVIPYLPLNDKILEIITKLQLNKIEKRIKENYKAKFTYSSQVIKKIIERCKTSLIGARLIQHIINNEILSNLATQLIESSNKNKILKEIVLQSKNGKFIFKLS